VDAFNAHYRDIPIGRIYAMVSSNNRKDRMARNARKDNDDDSA
jgi:hypothetical protein